VRPFEGSGGLVSLNAASLGMYVLMRDAHDGVDKHTVLYISCPLGVWHCTMYHTSRLPEGDGGSTVAPRPSYCGNLLYR
jgi:hypothetical protein